MTTLPMLRMAALSAWNRRFVLALVAAGIALASFVLLGLARVQADVRATFLESVSGTDLVVGPRTGSVQLLLASVFHLGASTQTMRWDSAQAIARLPAVAWTVPLALGDTHRGFPVVGTTADYFARVQHGERRALAWAAGRPFAGAGEAVVGADVAERLHLALGDSLTLSHGDGAIAANDHAGHPFTVVGILQRCGTPVDRVVHVALQALEAVHAPWQDGVRWDSPPAPQSPPRAPTARADDADHAGARDPARLREHAGSREQAASREHAGSRGHAASREHAGSREHAESPAVGPGRAAHAAAPAPRRIDALLVGLTRRAAALGVQRSVADYAAEPLMAVLPGVALGELWQVLGHGERALRAMGALLALVGIGGLVATVLAGLDQRRRELAILRAVGAGPRAIGLLLVVEGALVTGAGVAAGVVAHGLALLAAGDWIRQRTGIVLQAAAPTAEQAWLLGGVLACGLLASLVPGWRAYRLSLADGLSPRI